MNRSVARFTIVMQYIGAVTFVLLALGWGVDAAFGSRHPILQIAAGIAIVTGPIFGFVAYKIGEPALHRRMMRHVAEEADFCGAVALMPSVVGVSAMIDQFAPTSGGVGARLDAGDRAIKAMAKLILVRSRDRVELRTGARGATSIATMRTRNCRVSEANGRAVINICNDQEVEVAAFYVLDIRSLTFKTSSREGAVADWNANCD